VRISTHAHVTRRPSDGDEWPRPIAVSVWTSDGSAVSLDARLTLDEARELAAVLDAAIAAAVAHLAELAELEAPPA
jgi:class 3 adenylate cyclase